MKRLTLALIAICILAGCATEAVPISQAIVIPPDRVFFKAPADTNKTATLVVTRDSGILGSACYIGFYIDGQRSANFGTKETLSFVVAPGEHIIGIGDNGYATLCLKGIKETAATVKSGEVKYFRIAARMNEGVSLEPTTQGK